MSRVEIDGAWEAQVMAAWHDFGDGRLGPDIATDAKRYCPVSTGALQESIESHMEDDDVIVSATGGADGREYASDVELGHRVFHPSTRIVGPETVSPEPFLRPSLYTVRGD